MHYSRRFHRTRSPSRSQDSQAFFFFMVFCDCFCCWVTPFLGTLIWDILKQLWKALEFIGILIWGALKFIGNLTWRAFKFIGSFIWGALKSIGNAVWGLVLSLKKKDYQRQQDLEEESDHVINVAYLDSSLMTDDHQTDSPV